MTYKTKSAAKAQLTRQLKNGQAHQVSGNEFWEVYGCEATGYDFRIAFKPGVVKSSYLDYIN